MVGRSAMLGLLLKVEHGTALRTHATGARRQTNQPTICSPDLEGCGTSWRCTGHLNNWTEDEMSHGHIQMSVMTMCLSKTGSQQRDTAIRRAVHHNSPKNKKTASPFQTRQWLLSRLGQVDGLLKVCHRYLSPRLPNPPRAAQRV